MRKMISPIKPEKVLPPSMSPLRDIYPLEDAYEEANNKQDTESVHSDELSSQHDAVEDVNNISMDNAGSVDQNNSTGASSEESQGNLLSTEMLQKKFYDFETRKWIFSNFEKFNNDIDEMKTKFRSYDNFFQNLWKKREREWVDKWNQREETWKNESELNHNKMMSTLKKSLDNFQDGCNSEFDKKIQEFSDRMLEMEKNSDDRFSHLEQRINSVDADLKSSKQDLEAKISNVKKELAQGLEGYKAESSSKVEQSSKQANEKQEKIMDTVEGLKLSQKQGIDELKGQINSIKAALRLVGQQIEN